MVVVTLVGMELVRSATGPAARLGAMGLMASTVVSIIFESCTFAALTPPAGAATILIRLASWSTMLQHVFGDTQIEELWGHSFA